MVLAPWTSLRKRTVWYVDASWNSAASKGEDVQGGKIRLEESVLLKVLRPGQLREEDLSRAHQPGETLAHGLVDDGNETWRTRHTAESGQGQFGHTVSDPVCNRPTRFNNRGAK